MTLKQVFSVFGMLVLRTILLICRRMLMRLVIQVLSFHLGISNYSGNIFRFTLGIVVIEKACTDPALPLGLPLRGREEFFSYNPPFLLRYVAFRKLSLKIWIGIFLRAVNITLFVTDYLLFSPIVLHTICLLLLPR